MQALEEELSASSRTHDGPGLVSIVVREATERPIKVCWSVSQSVCSELVRLREIMRDTHLEGSRLCCSQLQLRAHPRCFLV